MSRILLVDDSPNAQRMGERILREAGHEVVTVTDGEKAMLRLGDVDPDVVLADVILPGKSGYDVCESVKGRPLHRHVRVVLTAGLLEPFSDDEAARVRSDGSLRKPFEASALLSTVQPLVAAAHRDRERLKSDPSSLPDPERVRAAVAVAVEAATPMLIDEITRKVLLALGR